MLSQFTAVGADCKVMAPMRWSADTGSSDSELPPDEGVSHPLTDRTAQRRADNEKARTFEHLKKTRIFATYQ